MKPKEILAAGRLTQGKDLGKLGEAAVRMFYEGKNIDLTTR